MGFLNYIIFHARCRTRAYCCVLTQIQVGYVLCTRNSNGTHPARTQRKGSTANARRDWQSPASVSRNLCTTMRSCRTDCASTRFKMANISSLDTVRIVHPHHFKRGTSCMDTAKGKRRPRTSQPEATRECIPELGNDSIRRQYASGH